MQILETLPYDLSIVRLNPNDAIPALVFQSPFYSITKSENEISIVSESSILSGKNPGLSRWNALRFKGKLDFESIGIIAKISNILAEHKISVFVISSYDTDYVLIAMPNWEKALVVLKKHYIILKATIDGK